VDKLIISIHDETEDCIGFNLHIDLSKSSSNILFSQVGDVLYKRPIITHKFVKATDIIVFLLCQYM